MSKTYNWPVASRPSPTWKESFIRARSMRLSTLTLTQEMPSLRAQASSSSRTTLSMEVPAQKLSETGWAHAAANSSTAIPRLACMSVCLGLRERLTDGGARYSLYQWARWPARARVECQSRWREINRRPAVSTHHPGYHWLLD